MSGVAVLRLECGTVVTVAREAPREVVGVHAARRHDEVLAQRMTLEVVAKHDATKVRASLEDDTEQVVDLALEGQGTRPQRDDRGHAERLLGQFDRDHHRGVVGAPRDGVDHLDARSLRRSLGGGQQSEVREAALFLEGGQHVDQMAGHRVAVGQTPRSEQPDLEDSRDSIERAGF